MSYSLLVQAHFTFGALALATFWIQMMAPKKGAWHRLVGRIYFAAMLLVVGTAVPMTVLLTRGEDLGAGLLLGFLATITISSGVSAALAARFGNRYLDQQRLAARISSLILLAISILLLAMTPWGGALALGLGGLGTWAAVSDLRTKADALIWRSWLARHIEGVLGTGIAVHAAFFAFGLRRLLGSSYTSLHFLLALAVPTVAGMVAASLLVKRFVPEAAKGLVAHET